MDLVLGRVDLPRLLSSFGAIRRFRGFCIRVFIQRGRSVRRDIVGNEFSYLWTYNGELFIAVNSGDIKLQLPMTQFVDRIVRRVTNRLKTAKIESSANTRDSSEEAAEERNWTRCQLKSSVDKFH